MQTSTSIKEITGAIVSFHKAVGKIPKDAKNPFYKSTYATLSNILEIIEGPLNENGLAIVQFPEGENGLTTRLIHVSGEWMEATYTMPVAKQNDPQALGSSISYQRRYSLMSVLSLTISDEDDDGNSSSGKTQQQSNGQAAKPSIKEAEKRNDEIKAAVKKLAGCTTVDALKELKASLPDYVKTNASFVEHATTRYKELTAVPA